MGEPIKIPADVPINRGVMRGAGTSTATVCCNCCGVALGDGASYVVVKANQRARLGGAWGLFHSDCVEVEEA